METIFLGLTAEAWIAVGTMLLAIATCVLVITGIYQLLSIRAENKRGRTLDASDRYTYDSLLANDMRQLAKARLSGELAQDPTKFRSEVVNMLNYFDSIALGIEQGIYDEHMARQYNEVPLRTTVRRYLQKNLVEKAKINLASYRYLIDLARKWDTAPNAIPISESEFSLSPPNLEIEQRLTKQETKIANQNKAAATG